MIGLVPAEKLADYVGQEIGSSQPYQRLYYFRSLT